MLFVDLQLYFAIVEFHNLGKKNLIFGKEIFTKQQCQVKGGFPGEKNMGGGFAKQVGYL